jgi:hypothetical protein
MQAGLTKRVMSVEDIAKLAPIETPKKEEVIRRNSNVLAPNERPSQFFNNS